MGDRELGRIGVSQPRRFIGVAVTGGLGALLLWIALGQPVAGFAWRMALAALGGAALWLAVRLWEATASVLVLTETGLREADGPLLARVDQIVSVERGVFAFKPTNGFALRLSEPAPFAWRPGLWWRFGRRVAIGGVTSGRQTRPMADMLQAMLAERAGR